MHEPWNGLSNRKLDFLALTIKVSSLSVLGSLLYSPTRLKHAKIIQHPGASRTDEPGVVRVLQRKGKVTKDRAKNASRTSAKWGCGCRWRKTTPIFIIFPSNSREEN